VTVDITGKTKADVFAGYARRHYKAPLQDVHTPIYGTQLTWNATELTTVIGHITRTIEETTINTSTAYILSTYGLELQHALTRRWLISARGDYDRYDYRGVGSPQERDNLWMLGAGSKYYLGRHLTASLDYEFRTRNSNVSGADFNRNLVMARLSAAF